MDNAISRLQTLIAPNAARFETVPEHWIHDWDEGLSFCRECAEKKIAELLAAEPDEDYMLDGGWGSEGDSQAFCETCERALENSFTDYAAEQELDHFEEYGFDLDDPSDCYAVLECTYALGSGNSESQRRLEKLAKSILSRHTRHLDKAQQEEERVEMAKTAELTLDEAIKAAREWQENAEVAIPAEIVTGLVDGAVELRNAAMDALNYIECEPVLDDLGILIVYALRRALGKNNEQ